MTNDIGERLAALERELAEAKKAASASTEAKPKPSKRSKKRKKTVLMVVIITVLLASAGGGIYYLSSRKPANPLASYASKTDFPLYYPTKLPDSYYLDQKNVTASNGLLSYTLTSKASKPPLTVTIQPTPKTFDASTVIGDASIPTQGVPIGSMYNISSGAESKYFITTDHASIIFLSSTNRVPSETINTVVNSLKQIQ